MKRFVFFHGYQEEHPLLDIDWDAINRLNNLNTIITPFTQIPTWTGTTYTPTWIVNPGLIQYTPPNYTTITITPGTGYVTLPYSGTINTAEYSRMDWKKDKQHPYGHHFCQSKNHV
jgi:hypothetical protein